MKGAARGIILLILVATIAATACWFSGHYFGRAVHIGKTDAHAWIHTQLAISPEQDRVLAPIEQRYAKQRTRYDEMLRAANNELAKAIREDRSDSERVKAAVAQIHQAQGELQNITLQHIFEMKVVLSPAQFEKLLKFTADALSVAEHGG